MNQYMKQVNEFREAMGLLDRDEEFWWKLVNEEHEELLKEACDVIYVWAGLDLARGNGNSVAQAEAEFLIELFGKENFNEAFHRVHKSNMSKLVDGKPVYNEDGKVVKGPNYKPPNLGDLI